MRNNYIGLHMADIAVAMFYTERRFYDAISGEFFYIHYSRLVSGREQFKHVSFFQLWDTVNATFNVS